MKNINNILAPLMFGGAFFSISSNHILASTKPNLVLVFVDDLGWGTFAPNFSEFTSEDLNKSFIKKYVKDYTAEEAFNAITEAMPNLSEYCKEGARFTNAYVTANVSSPSRVGLLTSSYQQRYGLYINSEAEKGIPKDIMMMPQVLRNAGYINGIFGKYHNGRGIDKIHTCSEGYHPLDKGFDYFFGFNCHGTTYYNSPILFKNRENVECSEFTTDKFTNEAIEFIDDNKGRPKLIYLPYNAVHGPLNLPAPEKYAKRFNYKSNHLNIYASYIAAIDEGVKSVMSKIEEIGELDNTMLVFMSDNGAPGGPAATLPKNGPFSGFKGQAYEGGIRVPMFIWYGTNIKQGTTNNQMVSSMDIFPTFFDAAGIEKPDGQIVDGKSLLPILKGENNNQVRDYLVWMSQNAENWGMNGIKDQGIAKASFMVQKDDFVLRYIIDEEKYYLNNLNDDIKEEINLAEMYPEKLEELKQVFKQWFLEMKEPISWKKTLWENVKFWE